MNLKNSAMAASATTLLCIGGVVAPAAQAASVESAVSTNKATTYDGPGDVLDAKCAYEAKDKGVDPAICDKRGDKISSKEKTCIEAEWVGTASILGAFLSGGITAGTLIGNAGTGGGAIFTCLNAK